MNTVMYSIMFRLMNVSVNPCIKNMIIVKKRCLHISKDVLC